MARRKKRQTKKKETWKKQLQFEVAGLLIIALSVITIVKLGKAGQALTLFFRFLFGEWYIVPLLGLVVLAIYFIIKRQFPPFFTRRLVGGYILFVSMLLLSHVKLFDNLSKSGQWLDLSVIRNTWELFVIEAKGDAVLSDLGGGLFGAIFFAASYFLFDVKGTRIIALVLIIIGMILVTGKSLKQTTGAIFGYGFKFFSRQWQALQTDLKEWLEKRKQQKEQKEQQQQPINSSTEQVEIAHSEEYVVNEAETDIVHKEPIIENFADHPDVDKVKQPIIGEGGTLNHEQQQSAVPSDLEEENGQIVFSEMENKDYTLPPLDLLNPPVKNSQSIERSHLSANARKLEQTFHSFGVKAKVAKVHLGPAVTKYEVYPEAGVKVSKIVNLSNDLALALAAKDIRIEAPIPGKSAVGIEVPNQEIAMVSLREVLNSNKNDPSKKLMIGLGRDISGEAVFAELNKMPHLLVAGATGSGKSVCINGIITSILMKAKPHEVKLMMVDPKMVELNVYNGVPHLLAPVVTNPKKAAQALKKVVAEMERRYDLFSHSGTRNIEGYNEHVYRHNEEQGEKQPELPYIVVIVDELADLMMVASGEVEDAITRLAQMARAAGIHLIIATQRPSVDVITGVIKANIPSRIAFSVSSQTDSRTILDSGGAEKLLGRGDMLFQPIGSSKPVRIQGAFLSDEEVERVVEYVISQQKAQYQEEMIPADEENQDINVDDDLYPEAVQLVMEMQTASVSMLQRRFRIGYTRAARLIDAMEANGVVGPYEGSKPREVLLEKAQEEATS